MMKDLISNAAIVELSAAIGLTPEQYVRTVKSCAFHTRGSRPVSDEALLNLIYTCKSHTLCPVKKEMWAIDDGSGNYVYFVGINGWLKIGNSHPAMNGWRTIDSENLIQMPGTKIFAPEWMEIEIYRKDWEHPVVIRQSLHEVYKPRGSHVLYPRTMLLNRTIARGFRYAFGLNFYEPEEAAVMRDQWEHKPVNDVHTLVSEPVQSLIEAPRAPEPEQSVKPLVDFDKHAVDGYLHKLRSRCLETGGWEAAVEVAKRRLGEGSTAALYAEQWLEKAAAHAQNASESQPVQTATN